MKIETVTLSGVDDNTSIGELIKLCHAFPFVEIGILLSQKHMENPEPRYPSKAYIAELCKYKARIPLSGHICRNWMKQLFVDAVVLHLELGNTIWESFQRVQFNYYNFFEDTSVLPVAFAAKAKGLVKSLHHPCFGGKQLILPQSQYSKRFIDEYRNDFPVNHVIFHDSSFGQGRTPAIWPATIGTPCGYAGSLAPDNIIGSLQNISKVVGHGRIWIDLESGLRDAANQFSFDRASIVCREAEKYV